MNGDDDPFLEDQTDVEPEDATGAMPMVPSAPPVSAPPASSPMRPIVGGAPLTGYSGFDASILAQKRAQLAQQDQDFARYLMQNARIQDAQKATDMAIRFLSLRKYGRDVETAVASGMDANTAAAMAAARNPTVFRGAGGAAAFIRALRPAPTPQQMRFPTSQGPVEGLWTGRAFHQFTPRTAAKPVAPGKLSDVQRAQLARLNKQEDLLLKKTQSAMWAAEEKVPEYKAAHDAVKRELSGIESQRQAIYAASGEVAPTAPVAAPAAAPAAGGPGPDYVFNSEADARAAGKTKGDVVRIKGVGKVRLK